MKKILAFSIIALLFTFAACKSSESDYYEKANDFSNYQNLAEALRSVGGVRVIGGVTLAGKDDVQIYLRGESSFTLNTQPLFVLNNVPVGTDYGNANNLINIREVASIRVLSGTHAVTRWGEDGNHGVIMIKTKDKNKKGS